MPTVVVAGEALIDLVPHGPGALAALSPRPGGGPYNTAVALGRLTADQWRAALGYAARAAAITCSRPGADPPWPRELG